METLAYYDQLTGLQNRLLFKEQLRSALSMAEREKHHLALMYLDLDHFKRINDTMGHEAGDQLLIEVAHRLRRCLREEDCVARLGRSEEHTSELQSRGHLVCRLLLEKKKE